MGEKQTGRDHGLAARDIAITAALGILRAIELEHVLLDVAGQPQREVDPVENGSLDRLRVLLNNGENKFHLGQPSVAYGVNLGDVGSEVAVWLGEIRQDWLGKARIALVSIVNGLGAVFRVLEGRD